MWSIFVCLLLLLYLKNCVRNCRVKDCRSTEVKNVIFSDSETSKTNRRKIGLDFYYQIIQDVNELHVSFSLIEIILI